MPLTIRQMMAGASVGMRAGGPGSGRHASLLSNYGFKKTGASGGREFMKLGSGGKRNADLVHVNSNGSWEHGSMSGFKHGEGNDSDSLAAHLAEFYGKVNRVA